MIIIFANSSEELQRMLHKSREPISRPQHESQKDEDHDQQSRRSRQLNDHHRQQHEEVDHYIYLGQRITMDTASKEQEIKRRITFGWQAFGRASVIFKNKAIPLVLKRKVYDQCILPVVTYGAETWNLTKKQTLKLRTMQRVHERIMLNITWRDHKTAEWIRQQTKVRDILEIISKAKWSWAGHLMRRDDNRWTTKLTTWQPRGHTRNRGRQKTRWRDDLDKFKNSGIKTCMTGEGGESWERPTSNNGPIKAERKENRKKQSWRCEEVKSVQSCIAELPANSNRSGAIFFDA